MHISISYIQPDGRQLKSRFLSTKVNCLEELTFESHKSIHDMRCKLFSSYSTPQIKVLPKDAYSDNSSFICS